MTGTDSRAPQMRLRNVNLTYVKRGFGRKTTRKHILRDIDLDLLPGETLGLIGRNGSGKTSLIHVMAGLMSPSNGSVDHYGHSVAMLGVRAGLTGWLSGRRNALLGGLLMGMRKQDIISRLEAIKDFSGLGKAFEDPISTYSTGMRARLSFSIAVECIPDILLVDEALSVGDRDFSKKSSARMRELIQSDRTIVLVSHSERLLRSLCDRLILLENGTISATGQPDDVLRLYAEKSNKISTSEQHKPISNSTSLHD